MGRKNPRFGKNRNDGNRRPRRDPAKPYTGRIPLEGQNCFTESVVGITEFVTPGDGFKGILKTRHSDFQVNEIDQYGNLEEVHDASIPKLEQPKSNYTDEELEAIKKGVSEWVNEKHWAMIEELCTEKRTKSFEIDVKDVSKTKRTKIHAAIKKVSKNKLTTSTVGKANRNILVRRAPLRPDRRPKWTFPGQYVHFLVRKQNLDTSEVAVVIANALRMKPSQVTYCGTKDRRAVTTQRFCVRRREPILIANALKRMQGVMVGNFSFHEKVLKLGDLQGNRFRIVLRHITDDEEEINKQLEAISERGFINYFGLQRFGNDVEIPTYKVGIALLKNDYEYACELILKPRSRDAAFMRDIRYEWAMNHNPKTAAAMFRNDRFIEKKLLDGLCEYGERDFANALRRIPRNVLMLYTHSYQSLIFNRVASRRIQKFGLNLIVGDLVYRDPKPKPKIKGEVKDEFIPDENEASPKKGDGAIPEEEDEAASRDADKSIPKDEAKVSSKDKNGAVPKDGTVPTEEDAKAQSEDVTKESVVEVIPSDEDSNGLIEDALNETDMEIDSKEKEAEKLDEWYILTEATEPNEPTPIEEESIYKRKVKALTEEDIASGKYTIYDVVLPLPGFDITYPANEIKNWYDEFLAEDDLTSELLKNKNKTYSLGGSYRKLLEKPDAMYWYFKKYDSDQEDVIPNDCDDEMVPNFEEPTGQYKALILEFCLPTSVYATMFIREVLKADTSPGHQAQLAMLAKGLGFKNPQEVYEEYERSLAESNSAIEKEIEKKKKKNQERQERRSRSKAESTTLTSTRDTKDDKTSLNTSSGDDGLLEDEINPDYEVPPKEGAPKDGASLEGEVSSKQEASPKGEASPKQDASPKNDVSPTNKSSPKGKATPKDKTPPKDKTSPKAEDKEPPKDKVSPEDKGSPKDTSSLKDKTSPKQKTSPNDEKSTSVLAGDVEIEIKKEKVDATVSDLDSKSAEKRQKTAAKEQLDEPEAKKAKE